MMKTFSCFYFRPVLPKLGNNYSQNIETSRGQYFTHDHKIPPSPHFSPLPSVISVGQTLFVQKQLAVTAEVFKVCRTSPHVAPKDPQIHVVNWLGIVGRTSVSLAKKLSINTLDLTSLWLAASSLIHGHRPNASSTTS